MLLKNIDLTVPSSSRSVTRTVRQHSGFKNTFSLTDTFPDHPKTSYSFTRSGVSITENDRISISDTGNLYIANIQIADLGVYKSIVRNSVTSTQYSRPDLDIQLQCKY